ncbi:MAG TPA: urease accessory protein UreD [Nitrosospira sp.]|nr:urease accessory protein UreD [Nitrosospira sp.]
MKKILFQERASQDWYTPSGLPAEVLAWGTPVRNLGVGASGKVGLLDLDFSVSGGATRLVNQFQQLPLYVFHPLYIDPKRRDMAFIYLLQSGEGIVQGDRYRLDLDCGPETAVHFTTQAVTKIYGMQDNFATQIVNLNAGPGTFVEYLPDPTMPFRGSRFYQRMIFNVDPSATVIVGETLLPGRVARGEIHEYCFYYTDLEARSPDGALLFADRLKLGDGLGHAASPGLLGSFAILAGFYVITRQLPPSTLATRLHDALAAETDVLAGISELPNKCGVFARIMGHTSAIIEAAMKRVWGEARRVLFNLPVPDLRKM